jgi:hypothetical protein
MNKFNPKHDNKSNQKPKSIYKISDKFIKKNQLQK